MSQKKQSVKKKNTNKTMILDTNILLQDPESIFSFEDNDVCIPVTVIEELDGKKTGRDLVAFHAREVIRKISSIYAESGSQYTDSVSLGEGRGSLSIITGGELPAKVDLIKLDPKTNKLASERKKLKKLVGSEKKDDLILYETACFILNRLIEHYPHQDTSDYVFITKDLAFQTRAAAIGVFTEDYKKSIVEEDFLRKKGRSIVADDEMISRLYSDDDDSALARGIVDEDDLMKHNERAILKSSLDREDSQHGTPVYKDAFSNVIIPIDEYNQKAWGVKTKGNEQTLALNALLDDNVKLVVLMGPSGCGKTFLSLAAGLEKTVEKKKYEQLLVSKPVVPVGKQDVGFLPGTLDEKLMQWFGSIFDNLEALAKYKNTRGKNYWQELKNLDAVDFLPLHSIRGRSINNKFIILDECQNMSPHEIKTFVSRIGENTKVVIMGDPSQIDAPYLDAKNNGLVYLLEAFENDEESEQFFSVCYFSQSQRSQISKAANRLL